MGHNEAIVREKFIILIAHIRKKKEHFKFKKPKDTPQRPRKTKTIQTQT